MLIITMEIRERSLAVQRSHREEELRLRWAPKAGSVIQRKGTFTVPYRANQCRGGEWISQRTVAFGKHHHGRSGQMTQCVGLSRALQ